MTLDDDGVRELALEVLRLGRSIRAAATPHGGAVHGPSSIGTRTSGSGARGACLWRCARATGRLNQEGVGNGDTRWRTVRSRCGPPRRSLAPESRAALRAIDLHFHDLRNEAGKRMLEADTGRYTTSIRCWEMRT